MKNILAENMRRFRTKNLNEQENVRSYEMGNIPAVPPAPEPGNKPETEPAKAPERVTKLTDIKDGDKFNLFKDAGTVTPLYTGTIVDAMQLQNINNGRVLFDIKIQGVGIRTIGWSGSLGRNQKNNPNANQFLLFRNSNNAHAWYNGKEERAGFGQIAQDFSAAISGDPVINGSTLVYNDKLGKLLKAYHGQASYDPTAAN